MFRLCLILPHYKLNVTGMSFPDNITTINVIYNWLSGWGNNNNNDNNNNNNNNNKKKSNNNNNNNNIYNFISSNI